MEIESGKLAELRVKHLEMIQAVISRVAGHGAVLKNYCITLTTAICGLAITLQRPLLALLSLLPITIFALLDAQYLRVERRFRGLFNRVRTESWDEVPSFEIDIGKAPEISYWRTLGSWSVLNFYAPLALGVVIVLLVARYVYDRLV